MDTKVFHTLFCIYRRLIQYRPSSYSSDPKPVEANGSLLTSSVFGSGPKQPLVLKLCPKVSPNILCTILYHLCLSNQLWLAPYGASWERCLCRAGSLIFFPYNWNPLRVIQFSKTKHTDIFLAKGKYVLYIAYSPPCKSYISTCGDAIVFTEYMGFNSITAFLILYLSFFFPLRHLSSVLLATHSMLFGLSPPLLSSLLCLSVFL